MEEKQKNPPPSSRPAPPQSSSSTTDHQISLEFSSILENFKTYQTQIASLEETIETSKKDQKSKTKTFQTLRATKEQLASLHLTFLTKCQKLNYLKDQPEVPITEITEAREYLKIILNAKDIKNNNLTKKIITDIHNLYVTLLSQLNRNFLRLKKDITVTKDSMLEAILERNNAITSCLTTLSPESHIKVIEETQAQQLRMLIPLLKKCLSEKLFDGWNFSEDTDFTKAENISQLLGRISTAKMFFEKSTNSYAVIKFTYYVQMEEILNKHLILINFNPSDFELKQIKNTLKDLSITIGETLQFPPKQEEERDNFLKELRNLRSRIAAFFFTELYAFCSKRGLTITTLDDPNPTLTLQAIRDAVHSGNVTNQYDELLSHIDAAIAAIDQINLFLEKSINEDKKNKPTEISDPATPSLKSEPTQEPDKNQPSLESKLKEPTTEPASQPSSASSSSSTMPSTPITISNSTPAQSDSLNPPLGSNIEIENKITISSSAPSPASSSITSSTSTSELLTPRQPTPPLTITIDGDSQSTLSPLLGSTTLLPQSPIPPSASPATPLASTRNGATFSLISPTTSPATAPSTPRSLFQTPKSLSFSSRAPDLKLRAPIKEQKEKKQSAKPYPTIAELEKIVEKSDILMQIPQSTAHWNNDFINFLKAWNNAELDVLPQTLEIFVRPGEAEYLYPLLDAKNIKLPESHWQETKDTNQVDNMPGFVSQCFTDLSAACESANITLKITKNNVENESEFKSKKAAIGDFLEKNKSKVPLPENYEKIKELKRTFELLIQTQNLIVTTLEQSRQNLRTILKLESHQAVADSKVLSTSRTRTYSDLVQLKDLDKAQQQLSAEFKAIKKMQDGTLARKKWKADFAKFLSECEQAKIDILPDAKAKFEDYEIFFTAFLNVREKKVKSSSPREIHLIMFDCCNELLAMVANDPPRIDSYLDFKQAFNSIKRNFTNPVYEYNAQEINLFHILTLLLTLRENIPTTLDHGADAIAHFITIQPKPTPKKYPTPEELLSSLVLPDFKKTSDPSNPEGSWKKQFYYFVHSPVFEKVNVKPLASKIFQIYPDIVSTYFFEDPKQKSTETFESLIYDCSNHILQLLGLPIIDFENYDHFKSIYMAIKSKVPSIAEKRLDETTTTSLYAEIEREEERLKEKEQLETCPTPPLLLKSLDALVTTYDKILLTFQSSFTVLDEIREPVKAHYVITKATSDDPTNKQRVVKHPISSSYGQLISISLPTAPVTEEYTKDHVDLFNAIFYITDNFPKVFEKLNEMQTKKQINFIIEVLKYAITEHNEKVTSAIFSYLDGTLREPQLTRTKKDLYQFAIEAQQSGVNKAAKLISVACKPADIKRAKTPKPSAVITTPRTPTKSPPSGSGKGSTSTSTSTSTNVTPNSTPTKRK